MNMREFGEKMRFSINIVRVIPIMRGAECGKTARSDMWESRTRNQRGDHIPILWCNRYSCGNAETVA